MEFNKIYCLSRKKQALIQAKKCCETTKKYSEKLGIACSTGFHWKNNTDTQIPFTMLLAHEIDFGIALESLIVHREDLEVAHLFRKHYGRITPVTYDFKLKSIGLPKRLFYQDKLSHHAIVIGTDCILITGLWLLKIKKIDELTEVSALVIDRNGLLLDKRSLKEINPYPFTITERFLIYLDLKEYARCHFLSKDEMPLQITIPKDLIALLDLRDERFLAQVSQLIELGTPEAIRAFDEGKMTIESALQTLKSVETST